MKSHVIVGMGSRIIMFTEAFIKYFKDHPKLLVISDINQGRFTPKPSLSKALPLVRSHASYIGLDD